MTPPNDREDRRRRLTELSNQINALLRKGNIEQALRELAHGKEIDPGSNLIRALEKQIESYISQHGKHNQPPPPVSKALHGYSQDSRLRFEGEARALENEHQMIPTELPKVELSSISHREIEEARKINQERERIERERMRFQEEVRKLEQQRNRIEEERVKFEEGMQSLSDQRKKVEQELKKFQVEAHKLQEARAKHVIPEVKRPEESSRETPPPAEKLNVEPPEAPPPEEATPDEEAERYLAWQEWGGQDSRNRLVEDELRKRMEQQREIDGRRVRMEHEAKKLKDKERRLDEEWHRKEAKLHELEEQSRRAGGTPQPVAETAEKAVKAEQVEKAAPPPVAETAEKAVKAERIEKAAPPPVAEIAKKTVIAVRVEKAAPPLMKEKPILPIEPKRARIPFKKLALYVIPAIVLGSVAVYLFLMPSGSTRGREESAVQTFGTETPSVPKDESAVKNSPAQKPPGQLAKVTRQPEQKTDQTAPQVAQVSGQSPVPKEEKKAELPASRDNVQMKAPAVTKPAEAAIDMGVPVSNVPSSMGKIKPQGPAPQKKAAAAPQKQEISQQAVVAGGDEGDLTIHTVKRGETLASIARKYSTTIENLKRWNSLTADGVLPGQELYVYVKK